MRTYHYRKCSKCGSSTLTHPNIQMHRFPSLSKDNSNFKRLQAWAIFCFPEEDWSDPKELAGLTKEGKLLCGLHFNDAAYTSNDRKRLIRFAVPLDEDDDKSSPTKIRRLPVLDEHNYSTTTDEKEQPSLTKEPSDVNAPEVSDCLQETILCDPPTPEIRPATNPKDDCLQKSTLSTNTQQIRRRIQKKKCRQVFLPLEAYFSENLGKRRKNNSIEVSIPNELYSHENRDQIIKNDCLPVCIPIEQYSHENNYQIINKSKKKNYDNNNDALNPYDKLINEVCEDNEMCEVAEEIVDCNTESDSDQCRKLQQAQNNDCLQKSTLSANSQQIRPRSQKKFNVLRPVSKDVNVQVKLKSPKEIALRKTICSLRNKLKRRTKVINDMKELIEVVTDYTTHSGEDVIILHSKFSKLAKNFRRKSKEMCKNEQKKQIKSEAKLQLKDVQTGL